jgi:hypothetical protein
MVAPEWQPYREPVRSVILRTGAIAVLAGAAFAGAGLIIAMRLSLLALARVRLPHSHVWWLGGFAFIVIELIARARLG